MTPPPRHLWSGDWRSDSAAAAEELAARRARPRPEALEPETPPAPRPPAPLRAAPPRPARSSAAPARPAAGPSRSGQRLRVALAIGLFVCVAAGVGIGLGALFGSNGGGNAVGEAWLGLRVAPTPLGGGLVVVQGVDSGSPAERAGVKPGDVITEIGGVEVSSPADVHALIQGRRPGDQLQVGVERSGVRFSEEITLTHRP